MGNDSKNVFSSPDGRILGKMGHSDCISAHVLQNVSDDMDQQIFASGGKHSCKNVFYYQEIIPILTSNYNKMRLLELTRLIITVKSFIFGYKNNFMIT